MPLSLRDSVNRELIGSFHRDIYGSLVASERRPWSL